ncbi:hypothetical protein AgCh_032616 [Apium graveolens]
MFFADDYYIFYKAKVECAEHVLQMLMTFETASGQQINVDKSSVMFSRNVGADLKQELCNQLGFFEAGDNSMYLGLPSFLNRKKSVAFGYIKEKLQEKLQGWDKKKLSRGGKEILIKSVAQTLPNYTMSVFLLPIEVCKDLERAMCKFWWKTGPNRDRGIHWMSWERMSSRKADGGMGFRSIIDFNIALLEKQAWRVGNGQSISILNDPWLPDAHDPYIHSYSEAFINQNVSSLMVTGEHVWDVELISDMFIDRDAELILSIPLDNDSANSWYWRGEKLGEYSVKSAYLLIQDSKNSNRSEDNSGFWRKLWNLKIPSKVKNFLWRAVNNCLPTKDLLRVKQVQVSSICPTCNISSESTLHALVLCSFAVSCWEKSALPSITGEFNSFAEWIQLVFDQRNVEAIHVSVMLCWMLWKNRNELVWNQKCLDVSEVLVSALSVLNQWRFVQDKHFDNFLSFINQEDGREQWQLPSLNRVKVNTDAAIFENPSRFSYALIVRDHMGNLVEAQSECCQGLASPELAEAVGIREALSWVKNERRKDVIVETDCLMLVQWIRSSYITRSYVGRVVDECRRLLAGLQNQNTVLRFIKRSANGVAHYLARYSSSIADRRCWMGNVHPDFHNVLCNDLKLLNFLLLVAKKI